MVTAAIWTAAILTGILMGCKSPTTSVTGTCCAPYVISVHVGPTSAIIFVGMTMQMTDTVRTNPSNLAYQVSWNSVDTTKVSVDSMGLVRGKAPTSGVAICAVASGPGFASVSSCGTVAVVPSSGDVGAAHNRLEPHRTGR